MAAKRISARRPRNPAARAVVPRRSPARILVPRNPAALALATRKGGPHGKSTAVLRKTANALLKKKPVEE